MRIKQKPSISYTVFKKYNRKYILKPDMAFGGLGVVFFDNVVSTNTTVNKMIASQAKSGSASSVSAGQPVPGKSLEDVLHCNALYCNVSQHWDK